MVMTVQITAGKTVDCYTGIDQTAFGGGIPEIYYGAYANSLAYRQGVDSLETRHRFQNRSHSYSIGSRLNRSGTIPVQGTQ